MVDQTECDVSVEIISDDDKYENMSGNSAERNEKVTELRKNNRANRATEKNSNRMVKEVARKNSKRDRSHSAGSCDDENSAMVGLFFQFNLSIFVNFH